MARNVSWPAEANTPDSFRPAPTLRTVTLVDSVTTGGTSVSWNPAVAVVAALASATVAAIDTVAPTYAGRQPLDVQVFRLERENCGGECQRRVSGAVAPVDRDRVRVAAAGVGEAAVERLGVADLERGCAGRQRQARRRDIGDGERTAAGQRRVGAVRDADDLCAGCHQRADVGERHDTAGERLRRGQDREGIGAAENDGAAVTRHGVAERIDGADGEAERRALRDGRRRSPRRTALTAAGLTTLVA